jgi:rsbT co-antagonist protein RsbR
MSDPVADGSVPVAKDRIDRLHTALSHASIDRFDEPEAQVEVRANDDFGNLEGALSVFLTELADAKRGLFKALEEMQKSRDDLQNKLLTIDQQRMTIRELSTPILDLWEGVLTLPMVGVIDTQRALEMTEQLLARVVETGARHVIIDITGVEVVDTSTADHLIKLTRAARLLGAKCVVTGIGPNIARTLVGMGVELEGLRTMRTLREGLKACLEDAPRPVRRV